MTIKYTKQKSNLYILFIILLMIFYFVFNNISYVWDYYSETNTNLRLETIELRGKLIDFKKDLIKYHIKLRQDPNNKYLLHEYSRLLIQTEEEQELDKAKQLLIRLLTLESTHKSALNLLGVISYKQGNNLQAVQYWKKVIELLDLTDIQHENTRVMLTRMIDLASDNH